MPKANASTCQLTSSVSDVFRGMFDAVLAAAALPGLFVLALTIAAVIIRSGRPTPGPGAEIHPPAAA